MASKREEPIKIWTDKVIERVGNQRYIDLDDFEVS